MARQIYTHDVMAWKEKDALANPTPLQSALAAEAIPRAEELLRAGWRSLSSWIVASERDIASGHREAPQLRSTTSTTSAESLSALSALSAPGPLARLDADRKAFDAEWEDVLSARKAAKRLAGSTR